MNINGFFHKYDPELCLTIVIFEMEDALAMYKYINEELQKQSKGNMEKEKMRKQKNLEEKIIER